MKTTIIITILLQNLFAGSIICFSQNPLEKQWDYRFGGTSFDDLFLFNKPAMADTS